MKLYNWHFKNAYMFRFFSSLFSDILNVFGKQHPSSRKKCIELLQGRTTTGEGIFFSGGILCSQTKTNEMRIHLDEFPISNSVIWLNCTILGGENEVPLKLIIVEIIIRKWLKCS